MPPPEDWESDQQKGVEEPPAQKVYAKDAQITNLIPHTEFNSKNFPISLIEAITNRRSRRNYSEKPLTLKELSFLLYTTQGVQKIGIDERHGQKRALKRTVPSGGSRHPFETYLVVQRVENLSPGIYRYLAIEEKLLFVKPIEETTIGETLSRFTNDQTFSGRSAVFFIWTVTPYRTEWRYSLISYRTIPIEVGHICQNLYLACEAINAGMCAILAYDQKGIDDLIGVDGEEEFATYVAPVGKRKEKE
ncbi:MAG: SagB/ThcOx family dehydrogenase [Candidatus Heimdallarchaeota archaeon]|nr:SagB/ThcOx family dehydrogenase [Candidatus Heimdallarchaeota archaeon]